jgi:hypothetical protein
MSGETQMTCSIALLARFILGALVGVAWLTSPAFAERRVALSADDKGDAINRNK